MATIPASSQTAPAAPQEQRKFEPIPAVDEYKTPTILVVEVEKVTLRELKEEFREKFNIEPTHEFNFQFKVLDGNFKNRKVWGSAHATWHDGSNCRLRIWSQEIMGVNSFPEGYEFDSDHLVGQVCRVTIKNYTKGDGSLGESVADVLRAVPGQQAPTSVPVGSTKPAELDYEPF